MLSCCMFIFLCYVGIMADLLLAVLKNKRFLFSNYFGLWTRNYFLKVHTKMYYRYSDQKNCKSRISIQLPTKTLKMCSVLVATFLSISRCRIRKVVEMLK